MKKIFFLIAFASLLTDIQLLAVKAYPYPITVTQADGTKITIKMHGDEFFKYTTTEDGYLIRKDENGIYKYAKFNNNKFELYNQKANNPDKRELIEIQLTKKLERNPNFSQISLTRSRERMKKVSSVAKAQNNFPVTGSPRSLVILVNFTDKSYVVPNPNTAFTNLLNEIGYSANGGTGSARDYFIESSFGQFSPQFDVVGPFTLPQNIEYYGKNDASDNDQNPRQMVIDACAAADANGVDFTQYDIDNDGVVDNIFVYYAGYNEAEGAPANTVWPHRWTLANHNTKFDGKVIFDYACTSELRGKTGSNMCGIGTFAHEFGHVLGMVDYYHTTENKNTLGQWSIYDDGVYNNSGRTPPSYSAYDRFYLGWLTPTELKYPQNVSLDTLLSSNKALLISQNGNHNLDGGNPVPKEFFIIENRQKTSFDSYLPTAGMLIWHIDYLKSAWDNNSPNNYTGTSQTASSHMRVYLQPLSGNTTTPGTAFTTGSFTPTLWDGTNINKPITDINVSNGIVSFKFMGGGSTSIDAPIATAATDIRAGSFVANWNAVTNAKGYYLTVYSKTEGESNDTEGFDNGLEAPIGWKISAEQTTTSTSYSGNAIPAIIFENNSDSIQTEIYPSVVKQISFYIKSINSTTSKVIVKGWNGTNWNEIDTITVNSGLATTMTYDLPVSANFKRFKFNYELSSGTTAIDDITVTFAEKVEYICKNKWNEDLTDTLYNLVSGRMHYYKVIASDVAFYSDSTKIYEILSEPSNEISLETLLSNDTMRLRAEREFHTNNILVFLENLNHNILIYNTSGQLVANIKPTDLKVDITNYLRPHNIYILSVGNRFSKIIY